MTTTSNPAGPNPRAWAWELVNDSLVPVPFYVSVYCLDMQ